MWSFLVRWTYMDNYRPALRLLSNWKDFPTIRQDYLNLMKFWSLFNKSPPWSFLRLLAFKQLAMSIVLCCGPQASMLPSVTYLILIYMCLTFEIYVSLHQKIHRSTKLWMHSSLLKMKKWYNFCVDNQNLLQLSIINKGTYLYLQGSLGSVMVITHAFLKGYRLWTKNSGKPDLFAKKHSYTAKLQRTLSLFPFTCFLAVT